jgi:hypothetical protein
MDRDPLAWAVHRHVIDPTFDELEPPRELTRDLPRELTRELAHDLARDLARVAALQSHLSRRHRGISPRSSRAGRAGRPGRAVPRAARG